jgi:dihydrofolate reductase
VAAARHSADNARMSASHPPASAPALSLVAAVARNGVIGRDGGLAWSHPADLKHFRSTTQGHAVLMGRKTWDSLPERFRPLPGRRNLVISRQAGLALPGAEVHASLPAALQALAGVARVYVIGGGEIYRQALPLADELVLTEIDADLEGDTHFPALDPRTWQAVQRAPGDGFAWVTYRRVAPA